MKMGLKRYLISFIIHLHIGCDIPLLVHLGRGHSHQGRGWFLNLGALEVTDHTPPVRKEPELHNCVHTPPDTHTHHFTSYNKHT